MVVLSLSIHLSKIHMKNNDWKERLNVVYSTNPDFNEEDKKISLSMKALENEEPVEE